MSVIICKQTLQGYLHYFPEQVTALVMHLAGAAIFAAMPFSGE
jgi:hypothetical protein